MSKLEDVTEADNTITPEEIVKSLTQPTAENAIRDMIMSKIFF